MEFGEDIRSYLPLTVHHLHWPISAIVWDIVFVFPQYSDVFQCVVQYMISNFIGLGKLYNVKIIIPFFQMD